LREKQKTERAGCPAEDSMKGDPAYREIYSRRQQIIEPVFSDITYCKGMNRFTLRGTEKVDIQWKMYCIVHNIGKCIRALCKKLRA
jgi:hypothetical protein